MDNHSQDKIVNLCAMCIHVENSFFCASPVTPGIVGWRTIFHHESLSNMEMSATRGCKLCKVFLRSYLHAQLQRHGRRFTNTIDVRNYILDVEGKLAVNANANTNSNATANDRLVTGNYRFSLDLSTESFQVLSSEHNQHDTKTGFVMMTLKRFWGHEDFFDWAQEITFMLTSEIGSSAFREGQFYGRKVTISPDFHFAQKLLKECQTTHTCKTHHAANIVQMPKRLIHISSLGATDEFFLQLTEPKDRLAYLALSHRWSNGLDCTTSKLNLESRKNRIEFTSLPQTFQDAILTTISLGHAYVWIDCICIVQDDKHEWAIECLKMAQIYGNAILTIAAVTAEDSTAGFLGVRNNIEPETSCELTYRNAAKKPDGSLTVAYSGDDNNHIMPGFHNLLDQLGWTLQERMLSTRVLSFSKDKMFWECDQNRRLESLHFPLAGDRHNYRTGRLSGDENDTSRVYRWWYELLDDYCRRKLTFQMDKLPALSGLAAVVQEKTSDIYLAGVWQGDLSAGLAWSNHLTSNWGDKSLKDVQIPYRAPS